MSQVMNIVVIATLDTKGEEAGFIRDRIAEKGHTPIVVDPGSTGAPMIAADVSREEVALAGGESLEAAAMREAKEESGLDVELLGQRREHAGGAGKHHHRVVNQEADRRDGWLVLDDLFT